MGRDKTILFFPSNFVGHIHAVLAIADKLKADHNYRTVFITLGLTIDAIKDHGHELVELEEREVYEEQVGDERRTYPGYKKWPQYIARGQEYFSQGPHGAFLGVMKSIVEPVSRELIVNHDAIERAIDTIQPDLVVFDLTAAPVCVIKNQYKCPWVNVRSLQPVGVMQATRADGIRPPSFVGAKFYTQEERRAMAENEPEKWADLLESWKSLSETIVTSFRCAHQDMVEFFKSKGLTFDQRVHSNSPFLNIYNYPRALDYQCEDDLVTYPPRWVGCDSLVRQSIGQQDSREVKHWSEKLDKAMRGKKEMVYFSLGSLASGHVELMKKYIDYLKDDVDRLYVVSKGVNGGEFELNAGNMIGANYLPQTFFLERAKLAIIHGGNNGITESMYYGCPMIVLPMFGDQMDNAQRVEDVGLGRRLDLYHCTKKELRDAIERLTGSSELANRMRVIGEKMRRNNDLDIISGLLKTLIENKKLDEEQINSATSKSDV